MTRSTGVQAVLGASGYEVPDLYDSKLTRHADEHAAMGTVRQWNSIGTRIVSGDADALSNQLGVTSSLGCRLAAPFDAVRLIYLNQAATATVGMTCAFSVANDLSSTHNSAGTWVTGTIANAAARVSTTEPSITFSDWCEIAGGAGICYARLYIPSAGNTESSVAQYYEVAETAAQMAALSGSEWISSKQSGDFVTTPASFNSATITGFNAIAGIQYRARGRVITVMGVGDSIMRGTKGTITTDAFWVKAVRELKATGIPIESCNMGIAGQSVATYQPRAVSALSAFAPDVLLYGAFSPNGGTISAAIALGQRNYLSALRSLCRATNTVLLPMTGMPQGSDSASSYTNAQDDIRKGVNAVVRALPVYLDLDAQVANSTATGTASFFKPGYEADDVHLSELGNLAAVEESKRAIMAAAWI